MAHKPDANETEQVMARFKRTFSAFEQMEKKFQSLKDIYAQNIQPLADKIIDEITVVPDQKTNDPKIPTLKPQNSTREELTFDDEETLNTKIKKLAELIKKSKHFVAFTGRINPIGISTAGRKPINNGYNKKQYRKLDAFKATPSATHMALVGLMTAGPQYLKYLVTESTDGLHRKSGIPLNQLSELNGNRLSELCKKCGMKYVREYKIRNSLRQQTVHDHFTGRYCMNNGCGGELHDIIINLNETPDETSLELARSHSEDEADLYLTMGSLLAVQPACDLPEAVGHKWHYEVNNKMDQEPIHNLVIVNTRKTSLDHLCGLRIYAKMNRVMIGLMKELNLEIPRWNLQRYVKVKVDNLENRGDLRKLTISGIDINGSHHSLFTDVKLKNNGINVWRTGFQRRMSIENLLSKVNKQQNNHKTDEFVFNIPTISIRNDVIMGDILEDFEESKEQRIDEDGLCVELSFYGHYNEPMAYIELNEYLSHLSDKEGAVVLKMIFDPKEKEWYVGNKREQLNDEFVKDLWINYDEEEEEEMLVSPYALRNDD